MRTAAQILSAIVVVVVMTLLAATINNHYQAVQRVAADCVTTPLP